MSYQLGARLEGVRQNINLIKLHLDANAKTAIDVGCNEGVITCALDSFGLKAFGFESGKQYAETAGTFQIHNFSQAEICNVALSLDDIEQLPEVDVVLFLSVNQQLAKIYSREYSEKFLLELFKKCNKQMFFQPCMIYEKYGEAQGFTENDINSAKEYFDNLLYEAGEIFTSQVVGLSVNGIPPSEPYRPLILYSRTIGRGHTVKMPGIDDAVNSLRDTQVKLCNVELSKCISSRDMQAFSADGGWHRFVEMSAYLFSMVQEKRNDFVYENTPLFHYYEKVRPTVFSELWALAGKTGDIGVLSAMPLNKYVSWMPWFEPVDIIENITNGISEQPDIPEWDSHAFGPVTKEAGLQEVERLYKLLVKILNEGYNPEVNFDGYIRGYIMRRGSESKFSVTAGQHRLAILSVLNYKNVLIKFQPDMDRVVDVAEVETWPMVKNGMYSKQQALNIFNGIFDADGFSFSG
ncbi:hypothetical protein [Rheinheimera sp. EpRS3]|uniref:hypothetical protein n=1 Tax=Rheinheimera sp. EpRS3 TaxID=1712383 RepID=UPI00074AF7A4|nr:hypothetical protein [Rheinheimera sp. EpRS3]KUM52403.1 hypothetical protein AR688_08865 [Rheinheimera sp. EpRS3]